MILLGLFCNRRLGPFETSSCRFPCCRARGLVPVSPIESQPSCQRFSRRGIRNGCTLGFPQLILMRLRTTLKRSRVLDPQEQIPLALRAAYLMLHRQSDAVFAPYGVTADQFVLLARLSEGESLTQKELAIRMPSDPSTVRAMLVLLEQRGLVRRDPHPTDGRARMAALTAAGRRKFRQLWRAGDSIRTQAISEMSSDDADKLVRLLKQFTESLDPNSIVNDSVT